MGRYTNDDFVASHIQDLLIRETAFHPHNANFVWPGNNLIAEYLMQHSRSLLEGKRILELGSATGVLTVLLRVCCICCHLMIMIRKKDLKLFHQTMLMTKLNQILYITAS